MYAEGRAGGQTDMTKLTGAFRDHANAPNKSYQKHILMEGTTDLHHI
jgi:hypothetical protein